MTAQAGDRIVIYAHRIQRPVRQGEIVEVRGREGGPPYLVRWEDSGRETLLFPGSDAKIEHPTSAELA